MDAVPVIRIAAIEARCHGKGFAWLCREADRVSIGEAAMVFHGHAKPWPWHPALIREITLHWSSSLLV
jgi:hypothetical protein